MKSERGQYGRTSPRWAFLEGLDVGADGDPYLDRLRIIQTPWFGLYLHHIHRPDIDPDPHDHPWAFASLVLTGGYGEIVWPDKRNQDWSVVRDRPRWSAGRMHRGGAHMITLVDGPLWTLVLTGPRRSEWGFWTPAGYVPWREYISRQEAPCGCPSLWPCLDTCPRWAAAHPPDARDSR